MAFLMRQIQHWKGFHRWLKLPLAPGLRKDSIVCRFNLGSHHVFLFWVWGSEGGPRQQLHPSAFRFLACGVIMTWFAALSMAWLAVPLMSWPAASSMAQVVATLFIAGALSPGQCVFCWLTQFSENISSTLLLYLLWLSGCFLNYQGFIKQGWIQTVKGGWR